MAGTEATVGGNEWETTGDTLLYTRMNAEAVKRWRAEGSLDLPVPPLLHTAIVRIPDNTLEQTDLSQ